jgi:glycosyltransferase involved in cell wall biosynthesis
VIKLSIIIPVFGVAKYIKDCLDSLIPQVTDQVEIIFIDDGSLDDSLKILTDYIQNGYEHLNNIVILQQSNSGQSAARNYGLSVAKGDFFAFIDPDDFVLDNYIQIILNEINEQDFDILHFNCKTLIDGDRFVDSKFVKKNKIIKIDDSMISEIANRNKWFSFLRVIKSNLISKEFYPHGVIYEDIIAFSKMYKKGLILREITTDLYVYRVRENSSAHSFSVKALNSSSYGVNVFSNSKTVIGRILYRQFIIIHLYNMILGRYSFLKIYKWYFNEIFLNKDSLLFCNYVFFVRYSIFTLKYIVLRLIR